MYQFCGGKHYRDVSFPKIISLVEIYSFIECLVWLVPGLASVKTAETMNYASKIILILSGITGRDNDREW